MGGSDQLFGVGALLVLEAGLERIGGFGEHAGIGGKIAAADAAGAAPNRLCLADHVKSPWVSWTELLLQFYQARSRVQFPGATGMETEDIDAPRGAVANVVGICLAQSPVR